ncbi:MAG: mechanosensitive ion channel [Euryarchaeota archaeon]|nr:mechanosensitive ion channel [Euryarchaeota archaeon]
MRVARLIPILLVAALLIVASVGAQDPIQVLNVDTYDRTTAPGETVTFNWTVRNVDPISYDIEVSATETTGWTVDIDPTRIDGLSQNRAAAVRVSVTPPPTVEAETTMALRVFFTVFQGGAVVFIAPRDATVTIPSIFAEKKVLGIFANPLPPPLDNEWGVFLLDVVLWGVLAAVALFVVIPLTRRAAARTKTQIDDIIIRIVRTPFIILLFLYGTIQSLGALDRHIDSWIRETLLSIYQAALAIIIVYLAYRLFKDVLIYLGRSIAKRTSSHIDDVIIPLAEKIGLVIVGLAGLGLLLGYLNVDLTLFVAGGVVISMVLAFAAQDTISNFFSGLFLLADRPFREGDIIILGDGDWVEVRRIGLRTTRLFRFSDATLVTVPNNKLVNEKIANFSNPKDKGRFMSTIGVAYGSDPALVKRVLRESIDATPHIIRDDPALAPIVRFDAMADSSLNFFILVWIDDRANRFTVTDVLNTEIYTRLTKAGIEIPFPQRTVHLRLEGVEGPKIPLDIERIVKGMEDEAENPSKRDGRGGG